MKQLFGTDGIRGVAGEKPLDRATVSAFGSALGRDIRLHHTEAPRVLIGMDTRESGQWIAELVAGGLREEKVGVHFAGVVTTPGVAYLTRSGDYAAGVMISASHNPYQDNGIKVFAHSGFKLPDEEESEIETAIFAALPQHPVEPQPLKADPLLAPKYSDYLLAAVPVTLNGMKVVLDCGNGAASFLAPELFRRAGAVVTAIHNEPNGRNINLHSGALHVESLAEQVVKLGADAGAAFDGDADRAILVGPSGRVIDGDAVLLIMAREMQLRGELGTGPVVATVMSNLGLEVALQGAGLKMLRTPVGDKYVLEEMMRVGATLGGEQSGHIIFSRHATTGDGMLTALRVMSVAAERKRSLDELSADLEVFPQKLVNVRVRERRKLEDLPLVAAEIRACEEAMDGMGRVLVRYSGTEPLARVMVEGRDAALVDQYSKSIAAQLEDAIGAAR